MSDLPERPDFTAGLRILARLCRPALRPMVVSTGLAIVSTVLELVPFIAFFLAIRDLLDGTVDGGRLLVLALVVTVASAARFATWSWALKISHLAAFDVMAELRLEIARTLAQLPLGWFSRRRSGKVQRALTEDVQRLEVLLAHAIPELASALVFWVAAAIWLLAVDWALALAALGLAPVAFFVQWLGMYDSSVHVRRITAAADDLHGRAAEVLRHPPVVRLFDRFGAVTGPIEEAIDEAVAADEAWSRRYASTGSGFRVLITADFVVALPVGVWLLTRGSTDAPSLVLVLLLGAGILQPLERAYRLGFRLSWISYAGATVDAMLQETALPEPQHPQPPRPGPVEFDGVTFAHEPPTPTVSDVTFRAEVGEVTALVGPSGAGKSTLARLLARFWDVDTGAIRVGGVDVRDLHSSDLFAQLALVFQDPFLFSDTVAENLRVGRSDATDDELVAACRAARIHDTIAALPDGYDTHVGAGGVDLSGGERQRLTIARAMLRNAPIVVLDEATAMADPDSEAAIQEAISELVAGRTLIVIAHRLRTVASADRIVVVDGGRVVETGRHSDLVTAGGTYAAMWNDMLIAEATHLGDGRPLDDALQPGAGLHASDGAGGGS
jgi:ATP-binding cassette subfamily B protein